MSTAEQSIHEVDLTKLVKPGFAFWPKAQQYRHIIPANPERAICNCNLYDVASDALSAGEQKALVALMNSTLVGLFKTFYGRWAGTEGNLKTEVVDVNLLELPDPRGVGAALADKLTSAVKSMSRRSVGRLIEEQLMDCHLPQRARRIADGPLVLSDELRHDDRRALDDAVFELLGVMDTTERARLVQRLHETTARHFRAIRVVEIEKMEERSRTANRRFSVQELAADAWDAAELSDLTPLAEWLRNRPECTSAMNIPEERPALLSPSPMFDPNTVYFGKTKAGGRHVAHLDCPSREHANLVVFVANEGIAGNICAPPDSAGCFAVLRDAVDRLGTARKRFGELADSRTSEPRLQAQIVEQLMRWFVHGRNARGPAGTVSAEPDGSDEAA
ncbi:MAG: hypothetical protein IT449_01935 [Phycisphaerales bacterium]|nr:hypothetical protein [Phycisphaerales bacterium]